MFQRKPKSHRRGASSGNQFASGKLLKGEAMKRRWRRELGMENLESRELLAIDVAVGLTGNEPATAVMSPRDPNLVAVARGRFLNISYDGGATFTTTVNAVLPAGQVGFSGDSSVAFDSQNRLFWSYLTSIDGDGDGMVNNPGAGDDLTVVVLQVNPLTGTPVGAAVDLTPGNHIDDKPWIAVDANPTSPFADNIYVVWSDLDGPSTIQFARSINSGTTFSAPAQLSPGGGGDEGFEWPSHVAVAENGDVYVAWHVPNDDPNNGRIRMARSGNGAADWAGGTVTFVANPFTNGQAAIDDNVQTDATTIPGAIFWTQGANAPYILTDPIRPGHIYVVSNDDPNSTFGNGDDGDVVFASSSDYGATWTVSTISHGPVGSLQVFPTASIDQDGNIVVTWYDTRNGATNGAGNFLLDLYATVSLDGGATFSNDFQINDVAFDPDLGAPTRFAGPPATLRIGEYNGVASANGIAYAVWTGNTGTGQQTLFDKFSLAAAFIDIFEGNDDQSVATKLGSLPEVTLEGLTIHNANDEDWFAITANKTGILDINALFTHSLGNLDLFVYDRNNTDDSPTHLLGSSTGTADNERVVIPVVGGQTYYIRVIGAGNDTNTYSLEVENFAAPVPLLVKLDPAFDSGMMNNDDVTFRSIGVHFFVVADLSDFAAQGIAILSPADVAAMEPGAAVEVFMDGVSQGFATVVAGTNSTLFEITFDVPEGNHFLTSAVRMYDGKKDAAGNPAPATGRTQFSTPLFLTEDITAPATVAGSVPDMLDSSDSGMFSNDNVTNVASPAFIGVGEVNSKVKLFANGLLVGQSVVGTDASDGVFGNGLGVWEITSEPLHDGRYQMTARYEDAAGNISVAPGMLEIEIDTLEPNTAYLDVLATSDSGRSNTDNITNDSTPDVTMTTEDPNAANHLFAANFKYRIFDRLGNGAETLIFDSNVTIPGLTPLTFLTRTLPLLADGVHNLKLEVEDRAGNISHDFLLTVVIDTIAPANPSLFLDPADDSGVTGTPSTSTDRITNVTTPHFTGRAEADAIVRLWADGSPISNNAIDGSDTLQGLTVAVPLDGNLAFPNGQWNQGGRFDLNDPALFPRDGRRQISVTAEDVAGNESSRATPTVLDIFVDTQGPQITNVQINGAPGFNLFGLKPGNANQGPTPLVNALNILVRDLPNRESPSFLYQAIVASVAVSPGGIVLRGDYNGVIAISAIIVTNNPPLNGQPATANIQLVFASPLPDDRYTLTVNDTAVVDFPGNKLDGENNAQQPQNVPNFPSGDGQPGGNFIARFTVDSRPEIGVYASGSAAIDINGNLSFDTGNTDATNRDIVFVMGLPSDRLFAGNFAPAGAVTASGFDKLGAYGFTGGKWRFMLDYNHDGVVDETIITSRQADMDGLPFAGEFNAAHPGSEIGVFTGNTWYLDSNGNNDIDAGDTVIAGGNMQGYPLVGDFDGDETTDLATWSNNTYYFDFGNDGLTGNSQATLVFGFDGVLERPVAADMNRDGITDLGLFVPGRPHSLPSTAAEWYFLMSTIPEVNLVGTLGAFNGNFTPVPFAQDVFAQFGDEFALPLLGNFDPPVTSGPISGGWIEHLYKDVLGRDASVTEWNYWTNKVNKGIATYQQIAQSFMTSDERRFGVINKLYQDYLGRDAELGGLRYWTNIWNATGGPEHVQAGIIGSLEYYQHAGGTDVTWVTALYNNILGRAPDAQGIAYWTNFIQTHTRAHVVLGFVQSDEYRAGLVASWYQQYLGRAADAEGVKYWVSQMRQGLHQEDIQNGILASNEYRNKVV